MRRRRFLQSFVGLGAWRLSGGVWSEAPRRLVPVEVREERVIRTVVGLRPYRAAGFVVRLERVGEKPLVHNYGHGGAGITLSWGTSELAAELAWGTGARDFAVLGCGAVGLATARLLQNRGGRVTIYARELPPHTTSNVAGGQFGPAMVADPDRRTPEWNEQFDKAVRISHRTFQDLVGEEYGVRWLENYILSERAPSGRGPGYFTGAIDMRIMGPGETPFPGYYARRYQTMMIEPATYLHRLMEDVVRFGGRIEVREVGDLEGLQGLAQEAIVNCTGLGSRELFGDRELVPVKGQLTVLLPQPEVQYAYVAGDHYMFPRRDGILLGGTHESGNFSLEPNLKAAAEVMEWHRRFAQGMSAGISSSRRTCLDTESSVF